MLYMLFVTGSLAFDLLFLMAAILCFVNIEYNPKGVTFTIFGTLAVVALFSDINPFLWILHNFDTFIAFAIAYFFVGTGWAVAKWWFYISKLARIVTRVKEDFYKRRNFEPTATLTSEQYYQFMRDVRDATKYRVTNIPPKVSEHKALITSWMTYWPISALWTLINDPIVRLFDSIYYGIAEYLQAISNKKFAGIIKDPNGSP